MGIFRFHAEDALAATSLDLPAAQATFELLSIRAYSDDLADAFHDINAEWIGDMFRIEETDRKTLENPRASIIDTGGAILFVEAKGLGIVGACALQKTGDTSFELTKMGVRKATLGLKVGEFLLNAVIMADYGARYARCDVAMRYGPQGNSLNR